MIQPTSRRLALVLGLANKRSIAFSCVESLLRHNFDCIVTYQSPRFAKTVDKLVSGHVSHRGEQAQVIGSLVCDVRQDLPSLFQNEIPGLLGDDNRKIDTIVHSVAYANLSSGEPLYKASWEDYAQSQHISAYSFLETARCAVESGLLHSNNNDDQPGGEPSAPISSSLIALSYLGAVRAVPNYHLMGPAKAALEALVRGLALELGQLPSDGGAGGSTSVRVNAVSAGPVATLASRGIRGFNAMAQQTASDSPLRRSIERQEIADTVSFLATTGTGITGQTIYVDAGYSSCVPTPPSMSEHL